MMKKNIRLLLCFLIPLTVFCSAEKQDSKEGDPPAATAAESAATEELKISIKEKQEIRIEETGGKQRVLLRAKPHEGYSDLQVSPDQKWLTLLATYPFDAADTRAEQYHLLHAHLAHERGGIDAVDEDRHAGLLIV